jgi:hypothetical protein
MVVKAAKTDYGSSTGEWIKVILKKQVLVELLKEVIQGEIEQLRLSGLVWSGLLPGPGHATTCA